MNTLDSYLQSLHLSGVENMPVGCLLRNFWPALLPDVQSQCHFCAMQILAVDNVFASEIESDNVLVQNKEAHSGRSPV